MEIKAAFDQMNPNRALGLDGKTTYFYQKY